MSTQEQATRTSTKEIFEWVARYIWPFIVTWNVFLFQYALESRTALQDYKLYVAQNYTSKQDLEKMMNGLESRLGKRFDQFIQIINTGRK